MRPGNRGGPTEREFRKLAERHGIAIEDGSPSKAADFMVFPNVLVEVKCVSRKSFQFSNDSARGYRQWERFAGKITTYPWIEIIYAVWFTRFKEWKWFRMPETVPKGYALRYKDGMDIDVLMGVLKGRQDRYAMTRMHETDPPTKTIIPS